ncbi:MAG: PE-PPE domain-containing protein [Candidatus Sericytochromatia bacterium]
MGTAKYIGRIGGSAVAPSMGSFRRAATRMTVPIGVAALVVMAPVTPVASASSSDVPPPDKTALIMGGTTIPTWNDADVEVIMNQFIAPTHPGQTIEPVAVMTPLQWWPLTGLLRLLASALGPPEIFGPGGAAWPDEPWWQLSGLFDLTWDQSVQAGLADLETAMAAHGNDHLVIYGYSQSAVIANLEKRKLAEQYPAGTTAPDIDFVLSGDGNLPNGGFLARFPGLYIPILDASFNGPEPTDTQFDTVVITRQYDWFADFPLYPINLVADLNALLGFIYVHLYPSDVSLAPDPSTSLAFQGTHGDTSYYFFETQDLPLFGPLRTLGVPESLIDVVEPFFRVIVELGYDRSIPPWEPTPARLIPTLDPGKVTADLVNAIGEGINNALALVGSPPLPSMPAPPTELATADVSRQWASTGGAGEINQQTSTGTSTVPGQAMSTRTTSETNPGMSSSGTPPPRHQGTPANTDTQTDPATSTGTAAQTEPATAAASASEPSTRPTPKPSAGASMPKPAKPAGRPATPQPVVRGSPGIDQQQRDLHFGDDDQKTAPGAAVGAAAATARPSSASSSSAGSSSTRRSPGSSSSGGDADGS